MNEATKLNIEKHNYQGKTCVCGHEFGTHSVRMHSPCAVCNCKAFMKWVEPSEAAFYDEKQPVESMFPMSKADSNIALKLRFVLLGHKIFIEPELVNREALGVEEPHCFETSQGIQIWFANPPLCASDYKYLQLGFGSYAYGFDANAAIPMRKWFDTYKTALIEFADNGCFFGNEKPATRIEIDNEIAGKPYAVFLLGECVQFLTVDVMMTLSAVIGKDVPIYEPKQFKSEWKKISPREFNISDLPQMIPLPSLSGVLPVSAIFTPQITDVCEFVIKHINELQQNTPEVWEFTIYTD